ncbi:MAG: hypothetical protein AAB497_03165 [Patescibacteria group bacterium]
MKGDFFHLLNRGVEKRTVFLNDIDYTRFVHNLYDFNDKNNVDQVYYLRRIQDMEGAHPYEKKKEIIDLLCWALMPNHPHILLVEREDGSAGVFSRKVFGGYTMYFNEENKRSGVLFQGKTKILRVEDDAHLLYLPFYIHANPLDLFQSNWKEDGIKDVDGAIKFLEEYRWSSLRDIIGEGNGEFAHMTNKKLFFEMFDTNEKKYKKDFMEWIRSRGYRRDNFEAFE